MILFSAIIVSGLLFGGFLMLMLAEARTGRRVLAPLRSKLDTEVDHLAGIVRRAEFGALFFHGIRAGIEYVVRTAVHGILAAVRAAERLLTRTARELRTREEMLMSSRTFVSAWFSRAKRRIAPERETPEDRVE